MLAETQVGRVEWLDQKSAFPGRQEVPLRRERARRDRQDPPPIVGRVERGHEDPRVLRLGALNAEQEMATVRQELRPIVADLAPLLVEGHENRRLASVGAHRVDLRGRPSRVEEDGSAPIPRAPAGA